MKSMRFKADSASSATRFVWYVLIGIGLVVGLVMWGLFSPGKLDHRYDAWAQLLILTTGVFGYLLKWGWRYKKQSKFWGVYFLAFIAHCAVFAAMFSQGRWNVLLLAVIGSLEVTMIATLVATIVSKKS